jgi:O-antigen ligase
MEGYHLRTFYVHNTYLALLVEFGVPGLALYGILFFNLFRLCWHAPPGERGAVAALRKVWPILLGVYLFNASSSTWHTSLSLDSCSPLPECCAPPRSWSSA